MKIGLQNFQGIGAYTEIPIAPITLFYGPNSAGKSTVADAFDFLSGTLSGQNKDWQDDLTRHARRNRKERPLEGAHLGEADDIVFLISCKEDRFAWRGWQDAYKLDFLDFIESHSGIKEAFFEERVDKDNDSYWRIKFEFQYQLIFSSNEDEQFFLHESQLIVGEAPLFKSGSDGINHLEIAFNRSHPLYTILDKQWPAGLLAEINQWFPKQISEEATTDECWLTIRGTGEQEEFAVHPIQWLTFANSGEVNQYEIKAKTNVSRSPLRLFQFIEWMMVMPGRSAARATSIHTIPALRPMPVKNEPITFSGYGESHFTKSINELDAWGILAGYIRDVELGGDPDVGETDSDEHDKLPANALSFVNHILNSPDFLDTGYAVTGDVKFSFDMDVKKFNELIELEEDERHERLRKLQTNVYPYLVYQPEGFKVEIEDVGVGISQVIPVLVGCWQVSHGSGGKMADDYKQVVHIQQPELHLHPKLQAQMGDVFLKSLFESGGYKRGFFLLESHSEHLLLRILRRIREHYSASCLQNATDEQRKDWLDKVFSSELNSVDSKKLSEDQRKVIRKRIDESGGDLGKFVMPDFMFSPERREIIKAHEFNARSIPVTADLISVVYVKKDKDGLTKMKHLRLADDGEFIDRWPDGFFSDRDKELFGEGGPFA